MSGGKCPDTLSEKLLSRRAGGSVLNCDAQ